ncbi:retention module-containing protein, partial [Marinomonas sp. C2222]
MSDSQIPFSTLGSKVASVSDLNGSVVVLSIDGQERFVTKGDPVYYAEIVSTQSNSNVVITFLSGLEFQLSASSSVEITEELLENLSSSADLYEVKDEIDEFSDLQLAVLAGEDPTAIQDAPAAGDGLDGSLHSIVSVSRDNNISNPDFGFESDRIGKSDAEFSVTNLARSSSSDSTSNNTSSSRNSNITLVAGAVALGAIAEDGTINSAEANDTVTITGTVTVEEGITNTIEVEVNGQTYTATVDENGSWSVEVDGEDVIAAIESGTDITVTVTSTDEAGNTATETTTIDVSDIDVDTEVIVAEVDGISLAEDGIINADESEGIVTITGTVTIEEGVTNTIEVEVNGQTYTATVDENGSWSVEVDGEDVIAAIESGTDITVTVTSTDEAGNTATETTTIDVSDIDVDTEVIVAEVDGISLAEDGIINADESEGIVTITGTVTIEEGVTNTIEVEVNGQTYTATVDENGSWSVEVDGEDVIA